MKKSLKYFVELINENPYASNFNKRDAEDKAFMERNVVQEWAASMLESYGRAFTDIRHGNDPPDFFFSEKDRRASLELTELVDEQLKSEIAHRRKVGEGVTASSPDIFSKSQWSKERFVSSIDSLVEKKTSKYLQRAMRPIDVLLIHSDEPWLAASQVEEWASSDFHFPLSFFSEVHFILTYDPKLKRWPVFQFASISS